MREPVTVGLYGTLADIAGAREVEIEAGNLRELYAALIARFPEMADHLEGNVSVSIDGRIYTESLIEPIGPGNEVVLLPRISGG